MHRLKNLISFFSNAQTGNIKPSIYLDVPGVYSITKRRIFKT